MRLCGKAEGTVPGAGEAQCHASQLLLFIKCLLNAKPHGRYFMC